MEPDREFRLYDFKIYTTSFVEEDKRGRKTDLSTFGLQMFGVNEEGKDVSISIDDYMPFFYVKVDDRWTIAMKNEFVDYLKEVVGEYWAGGIQECKLVKWKKMDGFDAGKLHKFIQLKFLNTRVFNKVRQLWYEDMATPSTNKERKEYVLKPNGLVFRNTKTRLYESNIPPMLRYFHITGISPSGWVRLPSSKTTYTKGHAQKTIMDYECTIGYADIQALSDKETRVPYNMMSWDIEASSSHGDFPVPIKSYKKLANNIVDAFCKMPAIKTKEECELFLEQCIWKAFYGIESSSNDLINQFIEPAYPKQLPSKAELSKLIHQWFHTIAADYKSKSFHHHHLESYFEHQAKIKQKAKEGCDEPEADVEEIVDENDDDDDDDGATDNEDHDDHEAMPEHFEEFDGVNATELESFTKLDAQNNVCAMLLNTSLKRNDKINELIYSLQNVFPELKGDTVTFIGSTFLKYGSKEPYLQHIISHRSCNNIPDSGCQTIVESYETEAEVLLAWTKLVQRIKPHVFYGYNIFGFDYEFLFRRAQELEADSPAQQATLVDSPAELGFTVSQFLQLSKNKDEVCMNTDYKTGEQSITKSSITISTGTYDLSIVEIPGIFQIDMLNWFRRNDTSLTSFTLDHVSSKVISDYVKVDKETGLPLYKHVHSLATPATLVSNSIAQEQDKTDHVENRTRFFTKNNLFGLTVGGYIHIDEQGNSLNRYCKKGGANDEDGGDKFKVVALNHVEKWFEIAGHESPAYDPKVSLIWGLAKDDLTPKDMFRLTNEGPNERAIVAKYCLQDCNLVHYLVIKKDVMTDMSEMSRLCSVPMSFLVFRGQGIQICSYVSKKCREKGYLIPVIDKGDPDGGYEGAVVLEPKTKFYDEDDAVGVGDYGSLYPSSILSENLCSSSKVWAKWYDLNGKLLGEIGEKDASGKYIYDHLPDYDYVIRNYYTYKYIRKLDKNGVPTKAKRGIKTKVGTRTVCYAQHKNGDRAVIPAMLDECLKARKATKKLMEAQTDEQLKGVYNKRQDKIKCVANSTYGILGAKTSMLYDPDIAASTTATGRMLLLYAKEVIEVAYKGYIVETKYGRMIMNPSYVYGDTDSVFFKLNLQYLLDAPIGNAVSNPIIDESRKLTGEICRELTFEYTHEICECVSKFLKGPHVFEFDKMMAPLTLFSKKRYSGILYEDDWHHGHRKDMGLALKRKDYAPILKDIFGGVLDILSVEHNILKTMTYTKDLMNRLVDGEFGLNKLIVSKSLKSHYANPKQIAHKVLADRIGERDSGNKPASGDRVPYVFIVNHAAIAAAKAAKKKKPLMGDCIETPQYVLSMGIKVDYEYYIRNQIMTCMSQLFCLILEQLYDALILKGENYRSTKNQLLIAKRNIVEKYKKLRKATEQASFHFNHLKKPIPLEEALEKVDAKEKKEIGKLYETHVYDLIFKGVLTKVELKKNGQGTLGFPTLPKQSTATQAMPKTASLPKTQALPKTGGLIGVGKCLI